MVKNRSIRPPSNDNLGPASEFVHEMDGLSPNFGPLSTWTDGRVDGPRTAVFVRGDLVSMVLSRKHATSKNPICFPVQIRKRRFHYKLR